MIPRSNVWSDMCFSGHKVITCLKERLWQNYYLKAVQPNHNICNPLKCGKSLEQT